MTSPIDPVRSVQPPRDGSLLLAFGILILATILAGGAVPGGGLLLAGMIAVSPLRRHRWTIGTLFAIGATMLALYLVVVISSHLSVPVVHEFG
ncbi:hypothetical protein [Galbitalea soli]|uniref:Uncharacterized protein n=1 Tax=Galbitalea soli TaxID=1268042 RepID=A0A7C9TR59_9MICO|nr:hypothetical protein [Galbitalea soli]NEM91479.1 hypothetical protein [Galbitalea soli]NYJ30173.1 putative membrane protein [Galbitalea soli]